MYRLLIVDDEHHVVNWIADLLSNADGIEAEIMKAYSGPEALALLKKYKMDIIFLDIQMPEMNGLEVARLAQRDWPDTFIIFLTAYDNFNYIYHASQLPNTSYLLKTEDDDAILGTVRKTLTDIDLVRNRQSDTEKIKVQSLLIRHYMEQDYLRKASVCALTKNDLVTGNPIIDFRHSFFLLHCRITNVIARKIFSFRKELISQCLVMIDSFTKDRLRFAILEQEDTSLLFFFQEPSADTVPDVSSYHFLRNLSEAFSEALEQRLHFCSLNLLYEQPVTLNEISYVAHELSQYSSRNIEKYSSLSACLTLSQKRLKQATDASDPQKQLPVFSQNTEDLRFYLAQKDKAGFLHLLHQLHEAAAPCKSMHNLSVIELYHTVSLFLIRYINLYHLEEKLAIKTAVYPLYHIYNFTSWSDAFSYLEKTSEIIFDLMLSLENPGDQQLISNIEKYIHSNLANSLSVSEIAAVVNYNGAYISRLYKEKRGISLNEYVTRVRIKEAENLLLSSESPIHEIARMTGFDTAQYFSLVFKKATGVSPREYRKMHATSD